MKESQDSSNVQRPSSHARRDFLSLSLLAGSTLLLSAEGHGQTGTTQIDEQALARTIGLADSIVLYGTLLEDVRRMVLQKDAHQIFIAKYEATEWLGKTSDQARRLRALLEGAALTDQQKSELGSFLVETAGGGNDLKEALIRMRREPLEEIRTLDTDFDKIRADLSAASNALNNRNPGAAKDGLASAIRRLDKYMPGPVPNTAPTHSPGPAQPPPGQPPMQQQGQAPMQQQGQPIYQPVSVPASSLRELLQIVLDLLNAAPSGPSDQNHSRAYRTSSAYSPITVEPALQASIWGVLKSKLRPGSTVQVCFAYGIAFPLLLRGDRNNRLKLLNDALRLVPPGLRDPLLGELANELANLP